MPRFKQVRSIQSAGQGDVWVSLDELTGDLVAQKFLRRHGNAASDDAAIVRFQQEVDAQSRLSHANIMPIVDFNFADNPPWYAMPLADGSLHDRLATKLPLSEVELRDFVGSVFDALSSAHESGLIHRDIKPANILSLVDDGESRWTVADFGVCRDVRASSVGLTKSGIAIGSARYMAPEQADNPHRVAPAADVYSLGCVVYYCVTGVEPGVRQLDYERVPDRFRDLLVKATALRRSERYPSVADFRASMDSILDSGSGTSGRILPAEPEAPEAIRRRIQEVAATSANLNDLSLECLHMLLFDVFATMGYRAFPSGSSVDAAFFVEDAVRGLAPVVVRQRRFRTASSDLAAAKSVMVAGEYSWAIFVTTGKLSPESQLFASGNREIVVLEGADLWRFVCGYRWQVDGRTIAGPNSTSEAG